MTKEAQDMIDEAVRFLTGEPTEWFAFEPGTDSDGILEGVMDKDEAEAMLAMVGALLAMTTAVCHMSGLSFTSALALLSSCVDKKAREMSVKLHQIIAEQGRMN